MKPCRFCMAFFLDLNLMKILKEISNNIKKFPFDLESSKSKRYEKSEETQQNRFEIGVRRTA